VKFVLLAFSLSHIASVSAQQEPWAAPYTDKDATGEHVLGHWSFDEEDKQHPLTLKGAEVVKDGKFGSGLQSHAGYPVEDKQHAAIVTSSAASLNPTSAFSIEMWVKADEALVPELRPHLLDKKYADHAGYQWTLSAADKTNQRRMMVTLGFGADSDSWPSEPMTLPAGEWHHLAFVYDGNGVGTFYRDGSRLGQVSRAGRKSVAPSTKALSLADRLGSNYGGFPGVIDEVRICSGARVYERVALKMDIERQVYRRMETARAIKVTVQNLQRVVLTGGELQLRFGGELHKLPLPELKPNASFSTSWPVDTALRPDHYKLEALLRCADYETKATAQWQVVARPPVAMPVIMWGAGFNDMDKLQELGFTHFVGLGAGGAASDAWSEKKTVPVADEAALKQTHACLDEALSRGLQVIASLSPKEVPMKQAGFKRVDRAGKALAREDLLASKPELPAYFEAVGRSVAKAYGSHPAFTAALINTEVRDNTSPSFTPHDFEAYKAHSGAEIPAEVNGRWGVDWKKLPGFPTDRVVADTHPILQYYRWFWTKGDGWNALHTALHTGVKANNYDVWTWFDPAVRQPPISGSGGHVDVLAHWTYTYPAPLAVGMCADQLAAMSAASGRNQRVMKMTQLIWYRSQTAPIQAVKPTDTVAWEDHDPDAAYITIAPQHLREAFWTKLSRPIQGIMYHGWNSLIDDPSSTSAYRFTHGSTAEVLKDLVEEVIQPLGPALLQIPDERSEVAFLESFTSGIFANRATYGNNTGWAADLWLALQHAHVQTDILHEETLLKSSLGGRKWLIMPHCDVLPAPVVQKITEWQKRGGKILADEFLCPALKADVTLTSFPRTKNAEKDKAAVLALATKLPELPRKANCDNPEIIVRVRKHGEATYVFAVNDKRESGTYVGQHGLVMENGVPSSGHITLPVDSANVYDLTTGRFIVPQRSADGTSTSWKVDLGPCDGRVFMVLPRPLLNLLVTGSDGVVAGNPITLTTSFYTSDSQVIKATVPLHIEVLDATGRKAEGTGYYATTSGQHQLKLDIASNETPGVWQIRIKELATQMVATQWVRVTGKQ
jgi:hypothetical protein